MVLNQLDSSFERWENWYAQLSTADQELRPAADKWTATEHLAHLILSSMGIISVLGKDKAVFAPFGKPDQSSRSVAELETLFSGMKGRKAPERFDPVIHEQSKTNVAQSWTMLRSKLNQRLAAQWAENDLDTYCLLHPRFGKLTLREMLIFMAYHNQHHLDLAQAQLRTSS